MFTAHPRSIPSQCRASSTLEKIFAFGNLEPLHHTISSPGVDDELSCNFVGYAVWYWNAINFGNFNVVPPQTIPQELVPAKYQWNNPLSNLYFSDSLAHLQCANDAAKTNLNFC